MIIYDEASSIELPTDDIYPKLKELLSQEPIIASTSHPNHSPQHEREGEEGTQEETILIHTSPSVQSHQTKKDSEVILKER